MKSNITLLGFALICSMFLGLAQADTPVPSLQDNMKQIGTLFKAIIANASDSTQNQQSAAKADQLLVLFTAVQVQVPDSISGMPVDQQADALVDFKNTIQREIDGAKALETAFLANDNTSAAAVIKQMTDTKKEGHGKFNP